MVSRGILDGVRVLDVAHAYSAALSGALLADLGAEVVCIEHPAGSPIRQTLPRSKGQALWWKNMARGKRCMTLDLGRPEGRDIFLEMAPKFDLMVENFRPGTLEKWGIGPDDLERAGANLTLLRISGFGQTGPMKDRPGFGTIAEAFSGFAYLNGFPEGPPVFPSIALADGVAATFGAFGLLASLVNRLKTDRKGVDVVDMALFEGLFRLSPVQVPAYDQLGEVMKRPGNHLRSLGLVRNLYHTADGVDFVVSTVGVSSIRRLMAGVDTPVSLLDRLDNGIFDRPKEEVAAFIEECDGILEKWAASRNWSEVSDRLAEADAVFERVYTTADIVADEQYLARCDVVEVEDEELGPVKLSGVVPKFSGREHRIAHAGQKLGQQNAEIYREYLGYGADRLERLRKSGVI